MSLETATYINQLDKTNPRATDSFTYTDDHILLIKKVLKNTFPTFTGPTNITNNELSLFDNIFTFETDLTKITKVLVIPKNIVSLQSETAYASLDVNKNVVPIEPLGAFGVVIWSILTEAKMTEKYGNIFKICNGDPITGSALHSMFGYTNVPDLITDNRSVIAEATNNGTDRKTYLYKPWDVDTAQIKGTTDERTHDHGGFPHKHFITGFHTNPIGYRGEFLTYSWRYFGGGSRNSLILMETNYNPAPSTDTHSHAVSFTGLNTETTPPCIFLNPFMRIN